MADAAALARTLRRGLWAALALVATGPAALAQPAPAPDVAPPVARSPVARADIDNTLAIGGDDIAAREVETRMTVAVQLNGRGPFRFVVDSGADTSVVGARTARLLALPTGTPIMLHGMTGSGPVDRVHVDELGFGQSVVQGLQLPVLKDIDLGGDGMLGIDALTSQRLMMDFDKRIITVEDARRPAPPRQADEVIVTARRRRGQLILTQASVDGRRLDAVIDTGSEVTIGNSALRAELNKHYADKLETVDMIGVTGVKVKIDLIRVAELQIGPVVLRDVPVAFADVPPFRLFGLSRQPGLLLGTDMMATFRRVSLDFRSRKVRFQLRRCKDDGFVVNTTATPTLAHVRGDISGAACL